MPVLEGKQLSSSGMGNLNPRIKKKKCLTKSVPQLCGFFGCFLIKTYMTRNIAEERKSAKVLLIVIKCKENTVDNYKPSSLTAVPEKIMKKLL